MYTEMSSALMNKSLRYDKAANVLSAIIPDICIFKKGSVDPLSERENQRLGNSIQGWSRGASGVSPVFIFN